MTLFDMEDFGHFETLDGLPSGLEPDEQTASQAQVVALPVAVEPVAQIASNAEPGTANFDLAAGDSNPEGKIWLYLTRQPKDADDVVQSKYFDLEVALVDRHGHIMKDVVHKLQLQVLLLYEDLSWVDRQDLLEVDPKTPAVVDRDGYVRIRVRVMEISRLHSRRRFVVYITAANETLTLGAALSRPLFVLSRKPKRMKLDDGPPKLPLEYPDAAIAQRATPAAAAAHYLRHDHTQLPSTPAAAAAESAAAAAAAAPVSAVSHDRQPAAHEPGAKRVKSEPVSWGADTASTAHTPTQHHIATMHLLHTPNGLGSGGGVGGVSEVGRLGTLHGPERTAALTALAQVLDADDVRVLMNAFLSRIAHTAQ